MLTIHKQISFEIMYVSKDLKWFDHELCFENVQVFTQTLHILLKCKNK